MVMQTRQPLRFGGAKSTWLASLPNSGTEMLTISSSGVVSRQAIPVASFGALTGLPSDNAALSSALGSKLDSSAFTFANLGSKPTTLSGYGITDAQPVDADLTAISALTTQPYGRSLLTQADASAARSILGLGTISTENGSLANYLPLTGGTLTGSLSGTSLTLSGIATINGGNQNAAGIQLGGSTIFGPYGLSNGWTFVQASAAQMRFSGGGIVIQSGKTFAWGNAFTDTGTTQLWEDASHVVAQRNGANAQTWRLYGTYTDQSNYRRLYISSTTGGAFTLGVEGLGTGASGNTLSVGNKLNLIAGGNSYSPDALSFGSSNRGLTAGSGSTDPIYVITSNGQTAEFSNTAFKLPSNRTIDWSGNGDNTGTATQARIAMNAYGQIDSRGDVGFRSRNLANTADAPISGSTGSFSGALWANAGLKATDIGPANASTGFTVSDGFNGNRMLMLSKFAGISGGFDQLRMANDVSLVWAANIATNSVDTRLNRTGVGQLDYYGNSGMRLYNYAGSDWSNLQAGRLSSRVYDTVTTDQSCIDLYNGANRSNINCGIMFRPGPPAHYVAHIQALHNSTWNTLEGNSLNFRVARNTGTTTVSTATLHSIMNLTAEGVTITPYSSGNALNATGYITSGMQTLVADPSTVDITAGLNRMVKNSTSGEVRHWVNDGGTMKSVLLS